MYGGYVSGNSQCGDGMFIVQTSCRPSYRGGASDGLDLTAAESKATYEEIKDYVLEHTGLKVSNLYIAQVKQKCGIIERVNYNQPKSENSRQPKCPPEKEKVIREALEHFRMI